MALPSKESGLPDEGSWGPFGDGGSTPPGAAINNPKEALATISLSGKYKKRYREDC